MSAHTLAANISHDTTNHPPHQRHAAFTPARHTSCRHTRSVSYETSSTSHTYSLQNDRFVRDFLQKSRFESARRAFRTRLPPKVTRQVSKTSASLETSSKSQAETPIGVHTSRSPAKQFRDSSPSEEHPLTRQSQCHSDIHNSQPHDSLRLPRIFPRPHV